MFASYVTFDLSPELAITEVPEDADAKVSFVKDEIPADLVVATRKAGRASRFVTDRR